MHETEQWRFWAGQVLMAGFDGTEPNRAIRDLIQSHHLGNIILFSRNVADARQLQSLTAGLQELAREAGQPWPLLIATDQENGMVRRLPPDIPGLPGNMALAATGDPALVREVGMVTGQLLHAVGINMDLAPVLDVNNNPDNPVIGVRSYGDRPDRVARFGSAMIRGLEAGGVLACGKHFPGHGDTVVDSHRALPEIPHDWERLQRIELPPFIHAMRDGLDAVMTAHIVFRAVDSRPATLSEPILTGWLRDIFGFNGVILTDCLEMDAIRKTVGVAQGAVDALKAGADIVLVSHSRDQQLAALNAIVAAVASGELPQSRLQEAAHRVQILKSRRLGDWNSYRAFLEYEPWQDLTAKAAALQKRASGLAVTWLSRGDALPLLASSIRRIAVLYDETGSPMLPAGSENPVGQALVRAVRAVLPGAEVHRYGFPAILHHESPAVLRQRIARADVIISGLNGTQNRLYLEFVQSIQSLTVPHVIFLLRSPYDARAVADAPHILALYETTPWMYEAGVRAIVGGEARGRLPVEVLPVFSRDHAAG